MLKDLLRVDLGLRGPNNLGRRKVGLHEGLELLQAPQDHLGILAGRVLAGRPLSRGVLDPIIADCTVGSTLVVVGLRVAGHMLAEAWPHVRGCPRVAWISRLSAAVVQDLAFALGLAA